MVKHLINPSVSNGIARITNFKFIYKGEKYEKETPDRFAISCMYNKYY